MRLVVVDCLAHEMMSFSIFENDMDFCERMTQKCEGEMGEKPRVCDRVKGISRARCVPMMAKND